MALTKVKQLDLPHENVSDNCNTKEEVEQEHQVEEGLNDRVQQSQPRNGDKATQISNLRPLTSHKVPLHR
jgi:hypothetical protein